MEGYHKIKKGDFRVLFMPKNGFKTCSAVNFAKLHADFGGLETTEGMKFRLDFFSHAILHMNSGFGMLVFFTNLSVMEFQVRYLALFLLFFVIDVLEWFWMESLHKNIQLMLEFYTFPAIY